jgi:hypothetical protein
VYSYFGSYLFTVSNIFNAWQIKNFVSWYEKTDLFDYKWVSLFEQDGIIFKGIEGLIYLIQIEIDHLPISNVSMGYATIKYDLYGNTFLVKTDDTGRGVIIFNGIRLCIIMAQIDSSNNANHVSSAFEALFPIPLIRGYKLNQFV